MLHTGDRFAGPAPAADEPPALRPLARLSQLLSRERILLGVPLPDARALFAHAAAHVAGRDHLGADVIVKRLARRHRHRSTALGNGIALPHAEVTHLPGPVAYFIRPDRPLDFGSAGRPEPVFEALVLLVRRPATSAEHALLNDLTHWFAQPALRSELDARTGVDAVWRLLTGGAG